MSKIIPLKKSPYNLTHQSSLAPVIKVYIRRLPKVSRLGMNTTTDWGIILAGIP